MHMTHVFAKGVELTQGRNIACPSKLAIPFLHPETNDTDGGIPYTSLTIEGTFGVRASSGSD